MALSCGNIIGSDVVAQQLFLGSSIVSFTSNTGWGGSQSTLTVELADDFGCFSWGESNARPDVQVIQIKQPISDYNILSNCNQPIEYHPNYDIPNHYYNCVGNSCYIDEFGYPYNPDRNPNSCSGASKIKIVPGKVYHRCGKNSLDQYYWRLTDPGFFGNRTRLNPNAELSNTEWRYNLIGIPVYFRFGYFTFGGIISGWDCNNRVGTPTYTVQITSADNLLKNCKVILSKFAGSIFTSFGADAFGSPTNYSGRADHFNQTKYGNIPNIFNVYGFLESYGFGTSNVNDNGIPLTYIIDALCVLTSSAGRLTSNATQEMPVIFPEYNFPTNQNKLGYHNAFSPYGRIIAPALMTDDKINPIYANFVKKAQGGDEYDYGFGIIPAVQDAVKVPRVEFLLDLSEVPRPPLDVRFNGSEGCSDITDIIREACARTGRDFYTTIIRKNGQNYIKIKTVDRTVTLPSNSVEAAVRTLEQSGLPVSQSSFGKEINEDAKPRVMYIGANQQRLFQTKSMLLGYSNTHLVYHPMLQKFVDYYRFGDPEINEDENLNNKLNKGQIWEVDTKTVWVDSYKLPLAYSTRNLAISNAVNSPIITQLFANEQELVDAQSYTNRIAEISGEVAAKKIDTNSNDEGFIDKPVGGKAAPRIGNYWPAITTKMDSDNVNKDDRYIPLWHHAISPFFGYAHDQFINLGDTGKGSNIYRFVRPVYLDTWAGILVIGFRQNELPVLSLGALPALYKYRFINPQSTTASDAGIASDKSPAGAGEGKKDAKNEQKNVNDEIEMYTGELPSDVNNETVDPTKSKDNPYKDPQGTLGKIGFVVTETELRAAAAGWESYLSYCLMKMPFSKPDLFIQLVSIYRSNGKLFVTAAAKDRDLFGVGGMGSHNTSGADNQAGKDAPTQVKDTPEPEYLKLNYNFNWVLNHEFIKDLQIIVEYLKGIHDEFYGKKYIIRIPEILKYRDYQYADIQIPVAALSDPAVGTEKFIEKIRKVLSGGGDFGANATPQAVIEELLKEFRRAGFDISPEAIIAALRLLNIQIPTYVFQTISIGSKCSDGSTSYDEKNREPIKAPFNKQAIRPENTIAVYQGSGKIFFNKDLIDGAWEEPGNYIDDSILVGTPDFFKLCNENGMIPPILGYNANLNKDYVSEAWCNLDAGQRKKALEKINKELADLGEESDALEEELLAGIFNGDENTLNSGISAGKVESLKKKIKYKQKQLDLLGRRLPDNCGNLMVPSLDLGSVSDPYVLVNVSDAGRKDAFGNNVIGANTTVPILKPPKVDDEGKPVTSTDGFTYKPPDGKVIPIPTRKVYFPTTSDGDIIFLDPINLLAPRVILNSPGVDLYFSSMSYQEDPNLTVINNAVSEDYAIIKKIRAGRRQTLRERVRYFAFIRSISKNMIWKTAGENGGKEVLIQNANLTADQIMDHLEKILLSRLIALQPNPDADPNDASTFFIPTGNIDAFFIQEKNINVTNKHRLIAPRKANPIYAGIPLKDNQNCYGPWTNYPWVQSLIDYKVYPGVINKNLIIEQLINDVDLKISDDWAPWNYGGMSILDREILNQINSNASYQLILENGVISMPGMPLMTLSGGLQYRLLESDVHEAQLNKFMGFQYHTLVQCSNSAYNGLIISTISTSVSERNISTTYRFATYNPRLGIYSKEISDRNKLIATNKIQMASKLFKVGRSLEQKILSQVDRIIKNNRTRKIDSKANFKSDLFGNSPMQCLVGSAEFYIPNAGLPISADPGLNSEEFSKLRNDMPDGIKYESLYNNNIARTKSWIGGFMEREALAELTYNFSSKAAMSLDGIFSPVSFFPTNNLGTYPVSSRFITEELKDDKVTCPKCDGTKIVIYYRTFNGSEKEVKYPCPLCNKPRLVFPSGSPENSGIPEDVNFLSLNPIVVPYGDFINPHSQITTNKLERSRHNIRIVGRQDSHQLGHVGLDSTLNLSVTANPENGDTNYELDEIGDDYDKTQFVNPDFYKYDLSFTSKEKKKILLNNRFFAFRGPMMLHGWGFDTEGYPVPNQADEPSQFDDEGRPLRFKLTPSGTNDYSSDGAYLPTSEYGLGDIIGSGYKKEDGTWKRTPSKYFHLNWAERSDLWPIGPIDLRWDKDRKVWVGGGGGCGEIDPPYIIASGAGSGVLANYISKSQSSDKNCPYKMVYVVLEENLVKINGIDETYPARGFLDDLEYNINPLPENTRKLIYIKDRCGYTAPRGAKLLCRYDRDTGFYEPITKQQYIVFGIITGGNNAIIDLTYIQGIKTPENIPKMNIIFDNTRFGFVLSGKKRGMFMFENGKWILIGTN